MNTLMHRLRAAVPRAPWNALRQRGSILVLTAFALPVILAGIGFAVDAGNIYMHKAQLQNAADAAALGGAKIGMKNTNDVSKFDMTNANDTATKLIATDIAHGDTPAIQPLKGDFQWQFVANESTNGEGQETTTNVLATSTIRYLKQKGNANIRYYIVSMQEDVPLLFLKYFLPKDTTSVKASSFVRVAQGEVKQSSTPPFTDLFVFKTCLDAVNSLGSYDRAGSHIISCTFDGRVTYVDQNAETRYLRNAPADNPISAFYTKLAKEKGLSFSEASKLGQATYGEDGYETSNGYWSKSEYRDFNVHAEWR